MTDSMETTTPGRSPRAQKVRTLAVGALATAALSISGLSATGVVAHMADRGRAPSFPVRISPDSHRLAAGTIHPNSIRLT